MNSNYVSFPTGKSEKTKMEVLFRFFTAKKNEKRKKNLSFIFLYGWKSVGTKVHGFTRIFMHGISVYLVWNVMRYFALFMQISLRRSDFRTAWIYSEGLKHLSYSTPVIVILRKTFTCPKHRIHQPDRKIH